MAFKKLKVGLAGCGFISQKHITAITANKKLELAAVCDLQKDRAEDLAKKQNCKPYFTYQNLLKDKDVDIIAICTPSGLHPKMIEEASEHKKNIIAEKPLALDFKSAKSAVSACSRNKVKLFVVHQARYQPAIKTLKKALRNKAFGKLALISIKVYWQRPQSYFKKDAWRGTWKFDGGVLLNQANHHIDLMRYLAGQPKSVFCTLARRTHKEIEVEDVATALISFRGGLTGVFEATTCTYPQNLEDSITVIGEKGTFKIKSAVTSNIEFYKFKNYKINKTKMEREIKEAQKNPSFGHIKFYEHVANMLLGGKTDGISGAETLKTLELIMASYYSAYTGKKVKLPFKKDFKLSKIPL